MENASNGRRAGLEKLLIQRKRACNCSLDTHTNTPDKSASVCVLSD